MKKRPPRTMLSTLSTLSITLSASLLFALAFFFIPFHTPLKTVLTVQAKAAGATEKPKIFHLKEGASSGYGQQEVSFTDQNGKTVDLNDEALKASGISKKDLEDLMPGLYADRASYTNEALTPIRDQGKKNLCWTFSATGLVEANMLQKPSEFPSVEAAKEKLDLSERQLAWFSHNTKSTLAGDPTKGTDGVRKASPAAAYTGGNYYQVTACLARGSGMTLEETLPYNATSLAAVPETDRYNSLVTLHDLHTVEYDMKNAPEQSVSAVKQLVDTFGAAGFSYLSRDAYYTAKSAPGGTAYYQKSKGTNHGACIVGYDDNYSASNFTGKGGKPPKDGAWYCRNSWGASWGDKGYFWLSYYDASINHLYALEVADSTKYGDIYQYDAKGIGSFLSADASANIFQARRDDKIQNVGIYTASMTLGGKIQIYVDKEKMTSPESGRLAGTFDLDPIPYPGYHVIDLPSTVEVKEGEYFSVILTLTSNGSGAMHAFEGKKGTKASAGQSFYKQGASWSDSNKLVKNACIKAIMSSEGAETAKLDELLAKAAAVTADSPEGLHDWMQKELKAANVAKASGRTDDIAGAVMRLERALSHGNSRKIYTDAARTTGPGENGAALYLNGGKYKKDGVIKKYGAQTYFHTVDKIQSWKRKGFKMVSAYYGNYVAAVTRSNTKPALDANGKITSPDTEAENILKVKAKGAKLTVKPLTQGTVYVWVLYYPKGGKVNPNDVDDYAMMKVTVGPTAPAAVKLYDTQEKAKSCTDSKVVQYKSTVMPQGESTDVYVAGTTGKKGSLAVCELDGENYEAVVPVKYQDYIAVERSKDDPKSKFTIRIAPNILDQFKIPANKTLSVKIPFCCMRNNKRSVFKAVIANPVKEMSFNPGLGTTLEKSKEDAEIIEVRIPAATDKEASSGSLMETKTTYSPERVCTDKTKIFRMTGKSDIRFNASNVLSVSTNKFTAQQKRIKMTQQKGQDAYMITAAKGTQVGTIVNFVVYHNAYKHESGTGYQIFKVIIGHPKADGGTEPAPTLD